MKRTQEGLCLEISIKRTLDSRGGILVESSSPNLSYKVCWSVVPSMVNLLKRHNKLEAFLAGEL